MSTLTTHKLAAAITAGAFVFEADMAYAGGGRGAGFTGISNSIKSSVSNVPQLLSVLAYLAGIALILAGIFKLKDHVENPGQTKLKDAVIRLGIGGAALAAPTVVTAATTSIGSSTGATTFNSGAFGGV